MMVVMVTPKDDYSTTDYDGDYGLATKWTKAQYILDTGAFNSFNSTPATPRSFEFLLGRHVNGTDGQAQCYALHNTVSCNPPVRML